MIQTETIKTVGIALPPPDLMYDLGAVDEALQEVFDAYTEKAVSICVLANQPGSFSLLLQKAHDCGITSIASASDEFSLVSSSDTIHTIGSSIDWSSLQESAKDKFGQSKQPESAPDNRLIHHEITTLPFATYDRLAQAQAEVKKTPAKAVAFLADHFPELNLLKFTNSMSPEVNTKDINPNIITPSMIVWGERFPEADRTFVSLLSLLHVFNGDLDSLRQGQSETVKLTPETFARIHSLAKKATSSESQSKGSPVENTIVAELLKDTVSTLLAVHDDGKTSRALRIATHQGITSNDHDKLLAEVLKHKPDIFSSFQRLPIENQEQFLRIFATECNLLQANQGESSAASLKELVKLNKDDRELFYLMHLIDLAGTKGHLTTMPWGSATLTEPVAKAYLNTVDAIETSINSGITDPDQIYKAILKTKADIYGFDIEKTTHYAVTRICAMSRVSDAEIAQEILTQYESLPAEDQEVLTEELNRTGKDDVAIKLMFSPSLINNPIKALTELGHKKPLQKSLEYALPAMARLFKQIRSEDLKDIKAGELTVDIEAFALAVRNGDFSALAKEVVWQISKSDHDWKITYSLPTNS